MKKLLLFTTMIFTVSFLFSQSFTIKDTHGDDFTNSTFYATGDAYAGEIVEEFVITNNSSSTLVVKAKKRDISLADSAEHVFCWAGLCYGETVYTSPLSLTMTPGYATSGVENLASHFRPDSIAGVSTVSLTVYDMNNVSDSAMITIVYTVTITNIDDKFNTEFYINSPYPNPSNERANFNFNLKSDNAYLNIFDIVGNRIGSFRLEGNKFALNTSKLHPGTYFYTIMVDGKKKKTDRLIVLH